MAWVRLKLLCRVISKLRWLIKLLSTPVCVRLSDKVFPTLQNVKVTILKRDLVLAISNALCCSYILNPGTTFHTEQNCTQNPQWTTLDQLNQQEYRKGHKLEKLRDPTADCDWPCNPLSWYPLHVLWTDNITNIMCWIWKFLRWQYGGGCLVVWFPQRAIYALLVWTHAQCVVHV